MTPSLPPQPLTVALTLSPINLRGADEPATVTIPKRAGLIVLRVEGERDERRLANGHAVVRTVSGTEVWRGPARPARDPQSLASLEIPAARLEPEDYILELFDGEVNGREGERHRYFFRVRD